jgi:hypothetical protein
MFISVRAAGQVTFEDCDDFRTFKVVVRLPPEPLDEVRAALANIALLPDRDTAWVLQDALRRWPGIGDPAWQEKFAAMIAKARPHGWIDDTNGTIKAHVEWTG